MFKNGFAQSKGKNELSEAQATMVQGKKRTRARTVKERRQISIERRIMRKKKKEKTGRKRANGS